MNAKLTLGNKAPDFRFKTPWDDEINFYNAVGNNRAVLIFLRYYGCPVCQMEMAKIKQEIELVSKKGGRVFVVLQSAPETLASLTNREDWPFSIISDPQGKIFQIYFVEAGGIIKYLHPAGLIAAIKAIGRGFRHGKFEGKETQLPAAFAITADKVIKYAHYGKNISDMPSLSKMIISI
ncbi:MAG: peroxiredoxin-like family protein [Deltaproteobacteria bacterium]|nr:peroxiredoxin-like family protein [Deltaproteobacteria bacterium]